MYYKVDKGAPLFDKIEEVKNKMKSANKKALNLVVSMGFEQFRPKAHALAGGISSFFSKEKPEGFCYTYGDKHGHPNDFFPKKIKNNKILLKQIEDLPIVNYEELTDLINYDWTVHSVSSGPRIGSKSISFCPGVFFNKTYVLFDITDCKKYKPSEGMIEITFTEYNKLKK